MDSVGWFSGSGDLLNRNRLKSYSSRRFDHNLSARRHCMARMAHLLGLAAVGLALTGCVSTEKYNALKLDRDSLAEQLSKSQSDGSAARAEADSYKNQLGMLGQNGTSRDAMITNLTSQLQELQKQYDALNGEYTKAMNRPAGGTA